MAAPDSSYPDTKYLHLRGASITESGHAPKRIDSTGRYGHPDCRHNRPPLLDQHPGCTYTRHLSSAVLHSDRSRRSLVLPPRRSRGLHRRLHPLCPSRGFPVGEHARSQARTVPGNPPVQRDRFSHRFPRPARKDSERALPADRRASGEKLRPAQGAGRPDTRNRGTAAQGGSALRPGRTFRGNGPRNTQSPRLDPRDGGNPPGRD